MSLPGATDDIAIRAEDVSKMYRLFASKKDRVREALDPRRRTFHREFWALRNISFDIPRGHTVGILGMNGSGKSTLLQIIAAVLQPTSGTVRVNGKVAALLELGAGFSRDLTARENVILNGTIMGLSRSEILERMPAIEAFADIGEFFDQPMKTHSSGMFMRVAFSTALYVDPEVLIIDEALSVGDAKFQEKCFHRFRSFQDSGKTILFVTHDRSAVPRYCDIGLLLHQGELVSMGDPAEVADLYGELLTVGTLAHRRVARSSARAAVTDPAEADTVEATATGGRGLAPPGPLAALVTSDAIRAFLEAPATGDRCSQNPTYNKYEHRFGNRHAEIVDYVIVDETGSNPTTLSAGSDVDLYLKVLFHCNVDAPIVGITFTNSEGVTAYAVNTDWMKERLRPASAGAVRIYRFTVRLNLAAGDWFVELAVAETSTDICDCRGALAHLYLIDRFHYVGLARMETRFAEEPLASGREESHSAGYGKNSAS